MKLEELEKRLLAAPLVALDTETTGLDWVRGHRPFAVSFAWRHQNYHGHEGGILGEYLDLREGQNLKFVKKVVPRLKNTTAHYSKFDQHMLRELGAPVQFGTCDCTMIREALIEENKYDYSLNALCQKYLKRMKADIWEELAKIFGGKPDKETQILNLHRAPVEVAAKYGRQDSIDCLEIWEAQEKIFNEENLHEVHKVERELLAVVVDMERGGVRVDTAAADKAARHMDGEIEEMQHALDRMVGEPVNVNSSPQVKRIMGVHWEPNEEGVKKNELEPSKDNHMGFWKTRDGIILEPTDSGKSGSLDTPRLYQSSMPEARLIVDIRGFIKARDIFLRKYVLEMNHKGYIHASFNQTRTEDGAGVYTGRFSITEPALQQIHKRNKKMAAIVRACFIPDEGTEWHCYDWSQVDFRAFAHYLNDPRINERYEKDPKTDFHGICSEFTGLPRDRDEKTGGANAKQINLANVFGMGAGKLAKECNLPYTVDDRGFLHAGPEAKAMFQKYHDNIPGVAKLRANVSSVARARGHILTPLKRRIRFPGGRDVYKSAGLLYQGTAADMLKVKMIELHRYQREVAKDVMRFSLVVHDESDVNILPGAKGKKAADEIQKMLQAFGPEDRIPLRIPILADHGVGINWWEASK